MFDLPKECYVNKFLPKKIFYEKVGVSSGVKEEFVNLVERITWLYKLSYICLSGSWVDEDNEMNKSKSEQRSIAVPFAREPDILISHNELPAHVQMMLFSGWITLYCVV